MGILTLRNLSKRFAPSKKYALHGVSLEVQKGELLSLVGESGSGKTTLLRLIAGFEMPTKGELFIESNRVVDPGTFVPPERRNVGMVFQSCALFPHLNVFDNIAFGLRGKKRRQRRDRVTNMISLVGLNGCERRYPHQLSGGEQQRVALARALAPEPTIILLDEPFSNLDETLKMQMRLELKSILTQTNSTAILVTHDTEDALAISGRIAILKDGEIQQVSAPEAIYARPANSYVANLFGQTNIINPADLRKEVQIPITVLENHPNAKSVLSVRPENFMIVNQCEGSICATVEDIVFHGRYKSLLLKADGQNGSPYPLTVFVEPDFRVGVKDRIHVRPQLEKIHVISA